MDAPHAGGAAELVVLDPDHPGFRDADYRARRNAIAKLALDYRPPAPVPEVVYTGAEQAVWRTVCAKLVPLHARHASRAYLEANEVLPLSREEVPQLRDVNVALQRATGFSMLPVAGLVSSRMFLAKLGAKTFLSTQYMRHPSVPFYTPEPDIVHELIGHAASLAHPRFVELNQAFGKAMAKADEAVVKKIERVYWYSLEFGLVREKGEVRAFGAGVLSSFGELERAMRLPGIQPWKLERVIQTPYDPTQYQSTLFVAESFDALVDEVGSYLSKWF